MGDYLHDLPYDDAQRAWRRRSRAVRLALASNLAETRARRRRSPRNTPLLLGLIVFAAGLGALGARIVAVLAAR